MFWYEFNGFLYVEKMFNNFFFPAKMLEMSPGECWVEAQQRKSPND